MPSPIVKSAGTSRLADAGNLQKYIVYSVKKSSGHCIQDIARVSFEHVCETSVTAI
ncbi:hypothetical protein RE6C_02827 [Rhodopirellula europaea 6C]|uniref:Uncharacterized protein n=1 Tax=Rhodopirellula europaea 6C TaxID=1263867 RepID=M2AUT8_9BACT|nr:hypothetical protein RE6C_02827 [Rhodopirellula europaea 6C]